MANHRLKGSERRPLPGARAIGNADPEERLEVTVLVRRRATDALTARVNKLAAGDKSFGHISAKISRNSLEPIRMTSLR